MSAPFAMPARLSPAVLIAQISDLHVRADGKLLAGCVDTATHLRCCVERIRSLPRQPDLLLATGDLVEGGSAADFAADYAALRQLLAPLNMPIYLMPGNHDDRAALRAAFPELAGLCARAATRPFIQYTIDDLPGDLRIVMLDTVVPGTSGGALCAARLAWLDARLREQPETPTLIAMHHPPFACFIGFMDAIMLEDSVPLERIVRSHSQVVAITCGHVHRVVHTRFAGVPASICPSPAHQIPLQLDPDGPEGFVMEPPGFQLHAWHPQAGLVTHTVPIGAFGPAHTFGG